MERGSAGEAREGFVPALEAARGIAALMVALLHVSQQKYTAADGSLAILMAGAGSFGEKLFKSFANGHGAVIFFFVLSGFVLALALKRQPNAPAAFAVNRVFRIYPAVISTILMFVLVYMTTGGALSPPRSVSHVLANMALLNVDIDGVMWTLQLEMVAAPIILLVFFAWRWLGRNALILIYVTLIALAFVGEWSKLLGNNPPLSAMHAFIAGMLAALHGEALVKRLGWSRVWLTLSVLGFFFTRWMVGWVSTWSVILESLFACGIVAQLAYGPFPRRPIPVLSYYGRISYSFYLLHPLSLIAIAALPMQLGALIAAGIPPLAVTLGLFVVSVAAITLLAQLQQVCIETPGSRLGKALIRRWRRPQPRAGEAGAAHV